MKNLWKAKIPWVYFVECVGHDIIKIGGTSTGVRTRMIALQHTCPFELVCIGAYESGPEEENRLHKEFAHLRQRGEWFTADATLRAYIQETCPEFDLDESNKTALVPDVRDRLIKTLKVGGDWQEARRRRARLEAYCNSRRFPDLAMTFWINGTRYPTMKMLDIAEKFIAEYEQVSA